MRVLVDIPNEHEIQALLKELRPSSIDLLFESDRDPGIEFGRSITAAISFGRPVDHRLRTRYPALQFIQLLSAGTDSICITSASWPNLKIADNAGLNSSAVSEHTVMLMLMLLRQGLAGDRNVRTGAWQRPPLNITELGELGNRLVGIIGMGRIGNKVAQRVLAFEARVQFYDIVDIDVADFDDDIRAVSLEEVISTSDIVSLHVPLTPQTSGLIDSAAIACMKKQCIVINTSRGAVVVLDDLVDALERRQIRGAGLDVFPDEPTLPTRLTVLDNVVLSPHRAGSSAENWHARVRYAYANLLRYAQGSEPESLDLNW
jgi:phosphoglycerate dehydrogenase-like enzyme